MTVAETIILTGPDGTEYTFPGVNKVSIRTSGGGQERTVFGSIEASAEVIKSIVEHTATSLSADDLAGVTAIGDYAFYQLTTLQSIELPEEITSIGESSFYYTGLQSIVIPQAVSSIGPRAFQSCNSLTSVVFAPGSQLRSLGDSCFNACRFESIDLPDGLTTIGAGCFYYAPYLTRLELPNTVTTVGGNAFGNCTALEKIIIPSSVVNLHSGTVYAIYPGSTKLKTAGPIGGNYNIEFGWTTAIPAYGLGGADRMTSAVLPETVTSLGNGVFYQCSAMQSLTCLATTPPTCTASSLTGLASACNIYVPADSVAAYKAATRWSARASYIQAIPT